MRSGFIVVRWCATTCAEGWCIRCCSEIFDYSPLYLRWKFDSTVSDDLSCKSDIEDIILCKYSLRIPFLADLIIYKSFYLDKWALYIEALRLFMCLHLVQITRTRYLVALIPWSMTFHQRHFHWLFSSLSMRPSSQMDKIELIISIYNIFNGSQLNTRWFFEGELPGGSTMSKHCLINNDQNYWGIKIGEGDSL